MNETARPVLYTDLRLEVILNLPTKCVSFICLFVCMFVFSVCKGNLMKCVRCVADNDHCAYLYNSLYIMQHYTDTK